MHICFSNDDRTCLFKLEYTYRIFCRDTVFKMLETSGRFDTGRIVKIFDTNWNSMEWTAPLASFYLCFHRVGLLASLIGQNSDERIDLWVELFNSFETCIHHFYW